MPRTVDLLDEGTPVLGPQGMVYSTAPRVRLGSDEQSYVTKGPEAPVVVAEVIAHAVAEELSLAVPESAVGMYRGAAYFASRHVDGIRDASMHVPRYRDEIARFIVLDIWLCNHDRNLGNLLLSGYGDGQRIIGIDFEKSEALRSRHPLIDLAGVPSTKLWPTEDLGRLMVGVPCPTSFVGQVMRVPDVVIEGIAAGTQAVVPGFDWSDSLCQAVLRRRNSLAQLVKESWR